MPAGPVAPVTVPVPLTMPVRPASPPVQIGEARTLRRNVLKNRGVRRPEIVEPGLHQSDSHPAHHFLKRRAQQDAEVGRCVRGRPAALLAAVRYASGPPSASPQYAASRAVWSGWNPELNA